MVAPDPVGKNKHWEHRGEELQSTQINWIIKVLLKQNYFNKKKNSVQMSLY